MPKTRKRREEKFWLDHNNPAELEVYRLIRMLKKERAYVAAVRDGIRLVCDLRAGRLDVLFELFPWVRAEFLEYMQALQPPGDHALKKRLDSLETLLLQQGNIPIGTGPKKLLVPPVAPTEDDDFDDALLVIRQATSERESARNFLDAAFNLVQ